MKRFLVHAGCLTASLSLFIILLISSADYCVYARRSFYKKTYTKYQVMEYARMELPEVLRVSDHLLAYLRGNEDTLEGFEAVVDGQSREFYSKREILHMKDVRSLFMVAIRMRRICMGLVLAFVIWMLWKGRSCIRTFVRYMLGVFLGLLTAGALTAGAVANDFHRAFRLFHKLLFHNNLWLLNPNQDWVIRLLPEGFFMDMARSIAITLALCMVSVLACCYIYMRNTSMKHNVQKRRCQSAKHRPASPV